MDDDRTAEAVSEEFTVADLHRIRVLVTRAAELVGLAVTAIDNLVMAVNEIAVNVIVHGGGHGHVRINAFSRGITVEITDAGPGLPAEPNNVRPEVGATGGRGLWLARRMCPTITFISTRQGLTVRLVAVAT